jgi:transposase
VISSYVLFFSQRIGGAMATKELSIRNPNAAGIDIGSDELFVSTDGLTVERFTTFSDSSRKLVSYLQQHGTTTVAMEATGVYWVPLFDMIEATGIKVCLVNGAKVRQIQGPKTDVRDCRWLQRLHSYGLLPASFIPDELTRQLRTYSRMRLDYIRLAAEHVQHMHKALDLMNIRLHHVISQITGASGLRVISAILAGERSPEKLLDLCETPIKKSKSAEVLASLDGTYREDQLFALEQALECWLFYGEKIDQCDKQIEQLLQQMTAALPDPPKISKGKKTRHHDPAIENLHLMLMKFTDGKDPTTIAGIADNTMLNIIAETGRDMSPWTTAKHFTSWMNLSPARKDSGRSKKNVRGLHQTRVGQLFRTAAQSLAASKNNALGGFYRRLKARKGPKVAMKALARKLAVMYYNVMKYGVEYVEIGLEGYEEKQKEHRLRNLERLARQMNLQLVPINPSSTLMS